MWDVPDWIKGISSLGCGLRLNYYLNEQLKAVQKELGDLDHGKNEFYEIEDKIKTLKLTKEAKEKAESELKKLTTQAILIKQYLMTLKSIQMLTLINVKYLLI